MIVINLRTQIIFRYIREHAHVALILWFKLLKHEASVNKI
jgi:hypothetical protein